MEGGSVSAGSPAPTQGDSAPTQAQDGAKNDAQPKQAPQHDDPEIELEDGVKAKKSELRDVYKRRKELDRGAFEKFQEASKLRKDADAKHAEAKELVSLLSSDVVSALRKAGKDPVAVAEKILTDALNEHNMSPAERAARESQAELERLKAENAKRDKLEQDQQAAARVAEYETTFGNDFVEAFQTNGLPPDPFLVGQMAFEVEALLEAGVPYSKTLLNEIAVYLDGKHRGSLTSRLQSAQDEQIAALLGEHGLEKTRQLLLRKAQAQPQKQQVQQSSAPRKVQNDKGLTRAELEARISQRIGA